MLKKCKIQVKDFQMIVTLRKTRGDDTFSACGQLSGDFMNKINLTKKTSAFLNV